MKKYLRVTICILLILALCGCGADAVQNAATLTLTAEPTLSPVPTKGNETMEEYDNANTLFEQSKYLDAYYAFVDTNYEDSSWKAKESLYFYANSCMAANYYIPAIFAYKKLNGYKDANTYLEEVLVKARERVSDNFSDNALTKFENSKLWVSRNNIYAINSSGELYAWGSYENGQLGNGKKGDGDINTYEVEQNPIKVLDNVTEVITGPDIYGLVSACYAIKTGGDLYAWGNNEYGQVGNGQKGDGDSQTNDCIVTEPVKVLSDVNQVWAVNNNAFALLTDGSLFAWGRNIEGSCGAGQSEGEVASPTLIMKNVSVKDICGGYGFSMVLMNNGDLYGWGRNYYGEIGIEKEKTYELENVLEPTKILSGVKKIVSGNQYSLALMENGDLYSWGLNDAGQVGVGDEKNVTIYSTTCVLYPSKILSGIVSIATYNDDESFAISNDGTLYGWGNNEWGHIDANKPSDGNWETKDSIVRTPAIVAENVIAGSPNSGYIDEGGFFVIPGGDKVPRTDVQESFLLECRYAFVGPLIDYHGDLYEYTGDNEKVFIMSNVKFADYAVLGPLVILTEDMELYTCGEFCLTEPGAMEYGSIPPKIMIDSIMAD